MVRSCVPQKNDTIPKVALKCIPQGKQCTGRPKTTWGRIVTTDLKELGWVWVEAEKNTRDCKKWRSDVMQWCMSQPRRWGRLSE